MNVSVDQGALHCALDHSPAVSQGTPLPVGRSWLPAELIAQRGTGETRFLQSTPSPQHWDETEWNKKKRVCLKRK